MEVHHAQGLGLCLSHAQEGRAGAGLLYFPTSLFLSRAYGAPFDKLCCARASRPPPLHHLVLLPEQIHSAPWCWKKRNSWDYIQNPLGAVQDADSKLVSNSLLPGLAVLTEMDHLGGFPLAGVSYLIFN